jgi:KDO2-lipid IV(A) lauroyltransferase
VSDPSDWIEYAALRGLLGFLARTPASFGRWFCRGLGDILFDLIRLRRRVTLENLRASFPEKTEAEIGEIARACYRTFCETVAEFARVPRLSPEELLESSTVVGREHLEAAARSGRGVILLTGHFGNWELLGALFPAMGYRLSVVVGEQHNRLVDRYINDARARMGVGVLSAEKDLRGILRALEGKGLLAIVGDQDAGRDGVFVEFLGRPASTAVGPVRLARRFGVPIVLGFAIRQPRGKLRFELLPPIHVPREGDDETVELEYTGIWSRILEDYVRRYPEHWFWMHRRWKTRPDSARRLTKGSGR